MKKLFPSQYEESFYNIDLTALETRGIRGIILDIDNTLAPYFVPEPDEKLTGWIRDLQKRGFLLYIVSNGKEARVQRFNRELNLPFVCHAGKPSAKGFVKAMRDMDLPPENTAVIGDQIFTDVWGGNRLGLWTILVKQVSPKDEWITAVKRPLEKIILFFYRRSGLKRAS